MARPRLRRFLLGDWNPIVRDPLDVLRISFLGGTIAIASLGRSTAIGLAFACLLLLVIRLADLPRIFDLAVILLMTMTAWGTAFSLYGRFYVYDNIVHALAPICYAPTVYVVLIRLGILPDLHRRQQAHHEVGIFVVTLALGMAVTAGYEAVEWLSDSIAGTHYVKSGNDTGGDIVAGTVGSAIGGILLVLWSVRGWGTVRRLPADVTFSLLDTPAAERLRRLRTSALGH